MYLYRLQVFRSVIRIRTHGRVINPNGPEQKFNQIQKSTKFRFFPRLFLFRNNFHRTCTLQRVRQAYYYTLLRTAAGAHRSNISLPS